MIYIFQPKAGSEYEARADNNQYPGCDCGAEKGCQHKVHKQRYAECCSGNQILQSGSHILAIGHFSIQVYGLVIVDGQLEQAEIHTAGNEYSPGDTAQDGQFTGCHSRYHQD